MNVTFVLPIHTLLSPNVTRDRHWIYRKRHTDAVAWQVRDAIGRKPPTPMDPAVVKITRFAPRHFDRDNLYASCKAVIDALKTNGIIVDDSAKHIDLTVTQEKCKRKDARVEVIVEIKK